MYLCVLETRSALNACYIVIGQQTNPHSTVLLAQMKIGNNGIVISSTNAPHFDKLSENENCRANK